MSAVKSRDEAKYSGDKPDPPKKTVWQIIDNMKLLNNFIEIQCTLYNDIDDGKIMSNDYNYVF